MRKVITTTVLIFLLITVPATQTISIDDFINHEPWTQQEVKNLAICAAIFAVIFIIYKKLPYMPQDPEFVFEDNHDDDEKKDEANPKAPVEVDTIVTDDDTVQYDKTDYDDTERTHKKETTEETGNLLENNSSFVSQIADFTW